jgi:small-conductance mechanosensitive channel
LLALLLLAALAAWWRTAPPSPKLVERRAAAVTSAALVDEGTYATARRLAELAATPEEQTLAQTALRVADHELALAFTAALRDVEVHPPALSPEALKIQDRKQKSQVLLDADQQRVDQLTAAAAQAKPAQKDQLQDELELAKSQLDLDRDELEEADQDLLAAGGNPQQRIEFMVQEHDAQVKAGTAAGAARAGGGAVVGGTGGALLQFREWLRLQQKLQGLAAAQAAAGAQAATLLAQRSTLASTLEGAKGGISALAHHTKSAKADAAAATPLALNAPPAAATVPTAAAPPKAAAPSATPPPKATAHPTAATTPTAAATPQPTAPPTAAAPTKAPAPSTTPTTAPAPMTAAPSATSSKASAPMTAAPSTTSSKAPAPMTATPSTTSSKASAPMTATPSTTSSKAPAPMTAAPSTTSSKASAPMTAAPSMTATPSTTDGASTMHTHADMTTLLGQTRLINSDQKVLTLLDRQATDLRQLESVYGQWVSVAASQSSALLHRLLLDAAIVIAILLGLLFLDKWIQRLLNNPKLDRRQVETLRSITRVGLRVIAVLIILLIFIGIPGQFGTMIGIVGAGLTVALKDFIVAFFGWLVLMGRNGIRLGDWVEINGVSGEVTELGMFHTVLLETGNWSDAGHPTGRRATFTNSFAIEGHYFNFSTSGQWLWDELQVVVPAGTDPYPFVDAITKRVVEATAENARQAEQEWQRAVPSQRGKNFSGTPGVNIKPVVGGVEIAVRYLTRAQERFALRAALYQGAVDLLGQKPALPKP